MIARDDYCLIDVIARKATNLRDTRSYKMKCRRELETMMKDLDCSHVFLTCSAANMQWHDFYNHMSDFSTFCEAIDTEKERLIHRLLQKNSHIAVEYLDRRFQLFFKQIIKKKFFVVDYWYSFEWQTRNNDHIHEFFWFENAFFLECFEEFLTF